MTVKEMEARLEALGVRRRFKPLWDFERGHMLLQSRRPAAIIDGRLSGCEIVFDGRSFVVWTSQRRRAAHYARAHALRIRLLDGEALLYLPAELADAILPALGAAVRRQVSPVMRERLKARLQPPPNALPARSSALRNGGSACLAPRRDS